MLPTCPIQSAASKGISRFGRACLRKTLASNALSNHGVVSARCASGPAKLPPGNSAASSAKRPPMGRREVKSSPQIRQKERAELAASLLRSLRDYKTMHLPKLEKAPELSPLTKDIGSKKIALDVKQQAELNQIIANRTRLIGPGIWSVCALIGTCGILAFLDVYTGALPVLDQPAQNHTILPQTWYLTPTVIKEGFQSGWNETDKLTKAIILAMIAVQLTKRSPLPIWQFMGNFTGGSKYSIFTYSYAHFTSAHLAFNVYGLLWFFPTVTRYFDNDLYQSFAFFTCIPIITNYAQHFIFRFGSKRGLPLNFGASGQVAAAFAVFCMLLPDEKVWNPNTLIFRLDAKYNAALWLVWQTSLLLKANKVKGGAQPAVVIHLLSFALGAAYVYLDGKNNVWKPLTAYIQQLKSE